MKRNDLYIGLLVAYIFFPLSVLLTSLCGYRLSLFHYPTCSIILTGITILSVLLLLKTDPHGKAQKILLRFLPILALTNWGLYLYFSLSVLVCVCMLICFICTLILSIKSATSTAKKIIGIIISVVLIVFIFFCSFLLLLFGSIGQSTVISTVPSPDGKLYAEVVDVDQGALGGDTVVRVHEDRGVDLLIFSIEKAPQTVYIGQWREYENMPVYWKSNTCLIIHSTEYYF